MNRRAALAGLAGAGSAAWLLGRAPRARAQARELPPDPPVAPRKPKTEPKAYDRSYDVIVRAERKTERIDKSGSRGDPGNPQPRKPKPKPKPPEIED